MFLEANMQVEVRLLSTFPNFLVFFLWVNSPKFSMWLNPCLKCVA